MKTKEMDAIRELRINCKLITDAADGIEIANLNCAGEVRGRENLSAVTELMEQVDEYLKTIKKAARAILRTFTYSGK